jgi:hypothetical protein
MFSHSFTILGLIRNITFVFSTFYFLLIAYFSLVRPKFKYAHVLLCIITTTNAIKLERIQWTFTALWYTRFFSPGCNGYRYANILQILNALYMREDISLMKFLSLIFQWVVNLFHLPWILLVFEFPLRTSEAFLCFALVHPSKNCPSARCATAENSVCSDFDVYRRQSITVKFDINFIFLVLWRKVS